MTLNDLLGLQRIDPIQVLVMRHRPMEPGLRTALPWLAAERPDVFNAYQRAHRGKAEGAMAKASHLASFIGSAPGKAVFVGLYAIKGSRSVASEEFWAIPENQELQRLGMIGTIEGDQRGSCLWFDLEPTDFYSDWKGKLVVDWPPPERSWWRWAARNVMPVHAIHEDSALVPEMPAWFEIALTWHELQVLPVRWRSALAQWRGIYLIIDTTDGKAYVGSAYGGENILGRWLNYSRSGHGGNRLLRERDPKGLQFAILERVSPDLQGDEVVRREAAWKNRLRTRQPHGLNLN